MFGNEALKGIFQWLEYGELYFHMSAFSNFLRLFVIESTSETADEEISFN